MLQGSCFSTRAINIPLAAQMSESVGAMLICLRTQLAGFVVTRIVHDQDAGTGKLFRPSTPVSRPCPHPSGSPLAQLMTVAIFGLLHGLGLVSHTLLVPTRLKLILVSEKLTPNPARAFVVAPEYSFKKGVSKRARRNGDPVSRNFCACIRAGT